MILQDLTPILPDPAVQNAGQLSLRKAILQCISDLARRVGDSLHLLEALGGVVGKLLGPAPLTTAVLECVAAAAVAVNFFPAKVCCRYEHVLNTCVPTSSAWLALYGYCAWPCTQAHTPMGLDPWRCLMIVRFWDSVYNGTQQPTQH